MQKQSYETDKVNQICSVRIRNVLINEGTTVLANPEVSFCVRLEVVYFHKTKEEVDKILSPLAGCFHIKNSNVTAIAIAIVHMLMHRIHT